MPAYIIGQVTVHDLAEYNKYLAGFPAAFAPFEGRVLVASDQVDVVEGQKIMTMPMTERLESKSTGRSCLFGGAKWIRTVLANQTPLVIVPLRWPFDLALPLPRLPHSATGVAEFEVVKPPRRHWTTYTLGSVACEFLSCMSATIHRPCHSSFQHRALAQPRPG